MSETFVNPPAPLRTSRRLMMMAAGAVMLAAVVFLYQWPTAILTGYLAGWLLWLGVPLGTTALALIHRMSGGDWGNQLFSDIPVRVKPIPWMAILFIPVLIGMKLLYPFVTKGVPIPLDESKFRHFWLTPNMFIIRSIVYFVVWTIASRFAACQTERAKNMQGWAGFCFLLLVITITGAAFDWVGLLSEDFYSTMFGLFFGVSFSLTAQATMILGALTRYSDVPVRRVHDWGQLLMVLVILHAYTAFSQFLIIWSSNIPREATWYLARNTGGWGAIILFLVVVQFFVPLISLIMRKVTNHRQLLSIVAGGLLAAQWLEMSWLILPSMKEAGMPFWENLLALLVMAVATIGIGLLLFPGVLRISPLTPAGEERVA